MGGLSIPVVPMDTGDGYKPPSLEYDFTFKGGFIPGVEWLNKPFIQAVIAAAIILIFWLVISRKLSTVPSKAQFLGELAYNFVRNGVARDMIGGTDFRRYTPYLVALFSFLMVNNLFGMTPPLMYPTMANIGYAWGLALLAWAIYNVAGFQKHGLAYLKLQTIPSGTPWWLLPLMVPIEALSNFIVRPVTLALRLFGNMLAGHAMVLVFVVGGSFLLTSVGNIGYQLAGGVALVFSFAIFGFELLVAFLQAYIFTVLAAVYVSSAISDEH